MIERYTTAPEAYDGFGTRTVCTVGQDCGKPVRLVEIRPEHLAWQEARYGSGMHGSLTAEQWAELVRAGLATEG